MILKSATDFQYRNNDELPTLPVDFPTFSEYADFYGLTNTFVCFYNKRKYVMGAIKWTATINTQK